MKKFAQSAVLVSLFLCASIHALAITRFTNVTSAKIKGTINAVMYGDNPSCYPGTIDVTIGVVDYTDGLGMMVDPLAENAIWQTVAGTLAPGALTFDFSVNTTMDGADVTVSVPGDPYEKDITSLFQQIVADGNASGKPYALCVIATGGAGKINLNATESATPYDQLIGIEVTDANGAQEFKYKKTNGDPVNIVNDRIQYTGTRAAHNQAYSDAFAVGGHSGAPSGSYVGLVEDRCSFIFHRGLAAKLGWYDADLYSGDVIGTSVENSRLNAEASPVLRSMPNPLTGTARIVYGLPENAAVQLAVYDANGRLVKNLMNGVRNSGAYEAAWDASDSPAGIYLLRLKADGRTINRKMIVMK